MSKQGLVNRAKKFCETSKFRFTEPRERVLSLLANCNQPMKAYQILESLSSEKEKINPPTVYRAIDFWDEHGFIHRVKCMNAYIACCNHQHHENFCILICSECQTVIELHAQNLPSQVMHDIKNEQFTISRSTTEIYGKCSKC